MLHKVNNYEIGPYLRKLITKEFKNVRQFCVKYLEEEGIEASPDEIRKKHNKVSQILQGKKGIRTYDLPIFSKLLKVSYEEILSAGKFAMPTVNHMTNYGIALSKDKKLWDEYLNCEECIFMNADEYGKTVLDYVFQYKNYNLLKYLIDNEYIILCDNHEWKGMTYGGSTKFKPRTIENIDYSLPFQIQNEDQVRTNTLALALENGDTGILEGFKAREVPSLALFNFFLSNVDTYQYFNENYIKAIAKCDGKTLLYFAEEFDVETVNNTRSHTFMFPFLGELMDELIRNRNKNVEFVLKRAIEHNKKTYEKITSLIEHSWKEYITAFPEGRFYGNLGDLKEKIKENVYLSEDESIVSYYDMLKAENHEWFATNIFEVTETSKDSAVTELINELNHWHDMVLACKWERRR